MKEWLQRTLNSESPQRRMRARSSTGQVSQAYSFFECLQIGQMRMRSDDIAAERCSENAHDREESQVVRSKLLRSVDGLDLEVDAARMDAGRLVVAERPQLTARRVDGQDLGEKTGRKGCADHVRIL